MPSVPRLNPEKRPIVRQSSHDVCPIVETLVCIVNQLVNCTYQMNKKRGNLLTRLLSIPIIVNEVKQSIVERMLLRAI